jgi:hypothetical protein
VHNSDQFKQPLLTFSETGSELVDIFVEQPHYAVVDEVTSESESTGYEFWSPKEPDESTNHETLIVSPSDPWSDQRDSSISKSLSF